MKTVTTVPAKYLMRDGEMVELDGYEVSSAGTIYRVIGGHKLVVPQNPDHGDYMLVNIKHPRLGTQTGYRSLYVHRVVMSSFCTCSWYTGCVADHIDTNRRHNELTNLRWLHITENTKRARSKRVVIIDTVKGVETIYKSIDEATKMTNLSRYHINKWSGSDKTADYMIRII